MATDFLHADDRTTPAGVTAIALTLLLIGCTIDPGHGMP